MSKFKYFTALSLIGAMLWTQFPAYAIVGYLSTPLISLAGIGVLATGGLVQAFSQEVTGGSKPPLVGQIAAIAGVVIGVALMDSPEGRTVQFGPVSDEQAAAIGLTSEEKLAYNGNLDELNDVQQQVTADLNRLEGPTVQDATAAWQRYQTQLPPEAVSAARKIVDSAAARASS